MDHVKETISTYDAIAEDYHAILESGRDSQKHKRWVEATVRRFAELLPGKKVLVAGCGTGRDSRLLSRLGLAVTSFDLSDGMLSVARSLEPEGTYLTLDMRDIGKLTDRFDGLLAQGCLYHLRREELEVFLDQVRNVLVPGAILVCSMKLGTGEMFVEKPSPDYPGGEDEHEKLRGRRFYTYYSLPEMLRLFRNFEILEKKNKHIHKEGVMEFYLRWQGRSQTKYVVV